MKRLLPLSILLSITIIIIGSYVSSSQADVLYFNDGSVRAGKRPNSPGSPVTKVETLFGIDEFQSDQIAKVESRLQVLAQYRHFRSQMDLSKKRCLKTLAWWCRQKGLYEEMFEVYDLILETSPEDPDLTEFIYEMALNIQYRGFEARTLHTEKSGFLLLKKTAACGPTLQMIGKAILAALPSEMFNDILVKGLKGPKEEVQLLSIDLLARRTPEKGIKPLIRLAIYSHKGRLREEAARALTQFQHDGIIYPFLRALKSNSRTYRMNALAGLAILKAPRTVGAIVANLGAATPATGPSPRRAHIYSGTITSAVTGFDAQVATSAAIASPKISLISDGVLLDVGVLSTHTRKGFRRDERQLTSQVLHKVTGIDYGEDYLLWRQWWLNNRQRLLKR